ncbi:protein gvpG [Haloprofundus marisrubri]|uniref:Protein gvpG n=1 Tax=Haloprofundus marisrubri TaxID=1514971 RepID=A0A0W1RCW7_9EURY|nr:protein gvpG [Haloprofundus marisrubri]KTG10953.1 protein gvpG [Haloprofundus marisrubri]
MFIIDDLLIRPFVTIADTLHTMAVKEVYDVGTIQDELKETRLLYELGELDRETYETRSEQLREDLELAKEMQQKLLSGNVQVAQA